MQMTTIFMWIRLYQQICDFHWQISDSCVCVCVSVFAHFLNYSVVKHPPNDAVTDLFKLSHKLTLNVRLLFACEMPSGSENCYVKFKVQQTMKIFHFVCFYSSWLSFAFFLLFVFWIVWFVFCQLFCTIQCIFSFISHNSTNLTSVWLVFVSDMVHNRLEVSTCTLPHNSSFRSILLYHCLHFVIRMS